MQHKVENLLTGKIETFGTDTELIFWVEDLVKENGDYGFSVLGISDAFDYLNTYCDNLLLL